MTGRGEDRLLLSSPGETAPARALSRAARSSRRRTRNASRSSCSRRKSTDASSRTSNAVGLTHSSTAALPTD
eukprot:5503723-Pyramimonas_sp.AAC.1